MLTCCRKQAGSRDDLLSVGEVSVVRTRSYKIRVGTEVVGSDPGSDTGRIRTLNEDIVTETPTPVHVTGRRSPWRTLTLWLSGKFKKKSRKTSEPELLGISNPSADAHQTSTTHIAGATQFVDTPLSAVTAQESAADVSTEPTEIDKIRNSPGNNLNGHCVVADETLQGQVNISTNTSYIKQAENQLDTNNSSYDNENAEDAPRSRSYSQAEACELDMYAGELVQTAIYTALARLVVQQAVDSAVEIHTRHR